MQVLRLCAVGGFQKVNVGFDYAFLGTLPSCMDSRNHMSVVIPKQDRDAVGSLYADKHIGEVGGEGIYTIEGKYLLKRILANESLVNDASRCSMHLMMGHEKAWNRDGNTAISCCGEGGDMRGCWVDVHA